MRGPFTILMALGMTACGGESTPKPCGPDEVRLASGACEPVDDDTSVTGDEGAPDGDDTASGQDSGAETDTGTGDDTGTPIEDTAVVDTGSGGEDTGEGGDTGGFHDALGCSEGVELTVDWVEPDDRTAVEVTADAHWHSESAMPILRARLAVIDAGAGYLTGEDRYVDHAWDRLQAIADWWVDASDAERNAISTSAEACWPHALAVWLLTESDFDGVTESFSLSYEDLLGTICSPRHRGGDTDALVRASGAGMALRTFPALDVVGSYETETAGDSFEGDWSDYLDDVWTSWRVQTDISLNDSGAEAEMWMAVLHLADLGGWPDALLDPEVEWTLARARDQLEPGGLATARKGSWADWVAIFERAASLYGHAGYRWAAHRVRQAAAASEAMSSMEGLIWADEWKRGGMVPRVPDCGSLVSTRRLADGTAVDDKMVVASSRHIDSSFAKTELYEESNGAFLGSMLSFETDGIAYIDALESDRVDPAALALETRFNIDPVAGEWQHAKMPTDRLPEYAPGSTLRHLVYFRFKLTNFADEDIQLTLDNVRLTGPGGTLMVEPFDDRDTLSTGWRAAEFTTDCVEGTHAAVLPFEPGTRSHHGGWDAYDVLFDTEIYPYIELDWKVPEGALPTSTFLSMETQTKDEAGAATWNYDWLPSASATVNSGREVTAVISDTVVDDRDGDSYGRVTFDDYISMGTTLDRRMVLTTEGVLVVMDTLTTCADCGPVEVGPLWQLPTEYVPDVDGHAVFASGFVDAEAGSRVIDSHLLLAVEPVGDRSVGVELTAGMMGIRHTASAKQVLGRGESMSMMTVLLPHDGSLDPTTLADEMAWPSVGEVSLPAWGEASVSTVRFGDEDDWSVDRE